ncbi:MAG TPA: right-handed parallel beta-helix repeat-containing protein [Terriglobia bacterium]|nr:right-handed parallel beta-helix repeat-containing protein [Terriglobia bacterium]
MRTPSVSKFHRWPLLVAAAFLLGVVLYPGCSSNKGGGMTVTVGPANADVIGTDNLAIQKAVDRVTAAGGGTVLIKAGTYTLANSVRLASHVTLRGEGPDKTILKKAAGVQSKLKLDADYGEYKATVDDASGFRPGMGVTVVDKQQRSGWTPSVRTITRIDGDTLYFNNFLQMDYHVALDGEVFNTFPLIAGFDVTDVKVEDLTADGSREGSGILDGCQTGAIYFFHSTHMNVHNAVARSYPGDGISLQFVEDPIVDHCDSHNNAYLGIHLGTGALRGIVEHNQAHENGEDGLYLCWRVQHARYADNRSWNNGRDGISLGHKDSDNLFVNNTSTGNGRAGIYFREQSRSNAPDRCTFEQNTIADNGRNGEKPANIHINGMVQNLKFVDNTIGSDDAKGTSPQLVGIYIAPQTDFITLSQNTFTGPFKRNIVNESKGAHNQITVEEARR